ncbi:hypothetical protein BFC22_05790 [Carnobacterium divergens]|uniref:hypothetical protein n=1 Tax=Carnobacterium divergens TaxID=2748 RepID=UPI000E722C8E|nr:hypothetical protein [Carnobacterium divergens]ANZ99630.1 hypothetical protein BFC22_05790 [Carnobacterium divergens]
MKDNILENSKLIISGSDLKDSKAVSEFTKMEIDDNPDRKDRCKFYIYSELGLIEQLVINLILLTEDKNEEIELNSSN